MIEALEVKLVQCRLFYHQAYASLVVVLGKINDELSQLLSKGGWESLRCNRQTINDPKYVFQAGSLPIELSLGVPLPSDLNAIRLVFCSNLRVDQAQALCST